MKKLILLFVISTFALTLGYAQQVPEKSTTIVSTQADSIGLKEKVLKVLADKGYTLLSTKNPQVISTAAKTLKGGARVQYNIQIKCADIFISGKIPVSGQAGAVISYQGKKGTPIMDGWEEMDKIAKALGGKIRYELK